VTTPARRTAVAEEFFEAGDAGEADAREKARKGYAGNQCLVPPKMGVLRESHGAIGTMKPRKISTQVPRGSSLLSVGPGARGRLMGRRDSRSPVDSRTIEGIMSARPITKSSRVMPGTVNSIIPHE
jgi:hypothetical protein